MDQLKKQSKIKATIKSMISDALRFEILAEWETPIYPIYRKLNSDDKKLFAEAVGCTPNGFRNIVMGRTVPGRPKAIDIKHITSGLVTVEMLRGCEDD